MEKFEVDQLMKEAYTMGSAFAYDGHDLEYSMNKFNLDKYTGLSDETKESIINQFKAGFENVKQAEMSNNENTQSRGMAA